MIYFSFIETAEGQPTEMVLLNAVQPEAAMAEATEALRDHPGATCAHVFDGDRFVDTAEAPRFGFAGVNATEAVDAPAPPAPSRRRRIASQGQGGLVL